MLRILLRHNQLGPVPSVQHHHDCCSFNSFNEEEDRSSRPSLAAYKPEVGLGYMGPQFSNDKTHENLYPWNKWKTNKQTRQKFKTHLHYFFLLNFELFKHKEKMVNLKHEQSPEKNRGGVSVQTGLNTTINAASGELGRNRASLMCYGEQTQQMVSPGFTQWGEMRTQTEKVLTASLSSLLQLNPFQVLIIRKWIKQRKTELLRLPQQKKQQTTANRKCKWISNTPKEKGQPSV